MWHDEGPINCVPQGYSPSRHSYAPRYGWGGSPFVDTRLEERRRLRRLQEQQQAQAAIEQEQLRRRQAAIDHRRRRQEAARQDQQRRVTARLRYIAASIAARTIQRWWRAAAATRKVAAGEVVLTALRRNVARSRGAAVATSLRQLRELEATIEAVPGLTPAEARGSDKASIKAGLVFEHTLEKLVLSADNIPTRGSETARAIRKRLVLRANARLQAHDELLQRVRAEVAEQQQQEEEATSGCDSSTDVEMTDSEDDTTSLNSETDVGSGEAGEPEALMDIDVADSKSISSEIQLHQACQRFEAELASLKAAGGNSAPFQRAMKPLQAAVLAAQRQLQITTSAV